MAIKKNYCIFCGKELADGKCVACGREAKPSISFDGLEYQRVPAEVAEVFGVQKKKFFGNNLYFVKEMIKNGDLQIADVYFDDVYKTEYENSGDSETEYNYYIQFSSPDQAPCERDCEVKVGQYRKIKQMLQDGQHEGKLLWGKWKKKNYYYVFTLQDRTLETALKTSLAESLMDYGTETEKRRIPPKGGFGNSAADKAFDAIWDNTIGKL